MPRSRSADPAAGLSAEGLLDALVQVAFAVVGVLTKVAADHEMSLTQLRVLAILRDRRVGVTALADYLGLEKSTMSGLIERAEKRGLLRRSPGASDGRSVEVSLTPQGKALAARGFAQVEQELRPLIGALGPTEQKHLQELLEQMLGAREKTTPGP